METIIKELKAANFTKKDFEAWLENDNVKRIYSLNKEKVDLLKDLWKGTPFEKQAEVVAENTKAFIEKSEEFAEELKNHAFKSYEAE
jgi:mannose/fructose-specific phosphotransferase system component IIA